MVDFSNIRQNLSSYYNSTNSNSKKITLQDAATEATKLLKEMDTNKDGIVSQAELSSALSAADNFKGANLNAEQMKNVINGANAAAKQIDKNNNGISEDELMSYLLYQDSTVTQGRLQGISNNSKIDGKLENPEVQYVALNNLNNNSAKANLGMLESTMQSFIATNKLNINKYNKTTLDTMTANDNVNALKKLGISVISNDTKALSAINISKGANGQYTISNLNGTANTPLSLNFSKAGGVNGITITGSSYVNTNVPSGCAVNVDLTTCTSTGNSNQKYAEYNYQSLKAKGITLSKNDVSTLQNININQSSNGKYQISGLNGTSSDPITVNVAKTAGVNSIEVLGSKYANITSNCDVVTTGANCNSVNLATPGKAAKIISDLKNFGVTLDTTDMNIICNITYSKNAAGTLNIDGLNGTASHLVNLNVKKTDGIKMVNLNSNSSNINYSVDGNFYDDLKVGQKLGIQVASAPSKNIQPAYNRAIINNTNLHNMGIILSAGPGAKTNNFTADEVQRFINLYYSKDPNTNIITLSNFNGTSAAPFEATLVKNVKVNITDSSNCVINCPSGSSATQAASCNNVKVKLT